MAVDHLNIVDFDQEIDDRLSQKPGHGRAADMVDGRDFPAKYPGKHCRFGRKESRPEGIVGEDFYDSWLDHLI